MTTFELAILRGRERDLSGAVKWPDGGGGFGDVAAEERERVREKMRKRGDGSEVF